jgi:hypothetical protein
MFNPPLDLRQTPVSERNSATVVADERAERIRANAVSSEREIS